MTIDDILDALIEREGPYSDRAADKGGPTCWGITQAVLGLWRGGSVSAAEVAALTKDEAKEIYRGRYVKAPHFDLILDQALQEAVVDAGVNHGTARPTKWLQQFLKLEADGILGADTTRAINAADPRILRRALAAARVRFYGRIIADDANTLKQTRGVDSQGENAAGWMDRAAHFIEQI